LIKCRNSRDRLEEAIEEQMELAPQTGCRLQISHLQAVGQRNWSRQRKVLARIEAARDQGIDVPSTVIPSRGEAL
jgi:N-acyl-D-amino-acid deacylase